jgi:hypothetical protein
MGNKPIDKQFEQLIFRASQQYVQNYSERHGKLKVICARMDAPVQLDEIFTPVQLLERSDLRYFESPDTLHDLFPILGGDLNCGVEHERMALQLPMPIPI